MTLTYMSVPLWSNLTIKEGSSKILCYDCALCIWIFCVLVRIDEQWVNAEENAQMEWFYKVDTALTQMSNCLFNN